MSAILPFVHFVRQLDLRTWDLGGRLTINPRTRYAEGRAGLSWTGVREYRTPDGKVLRVLRRPKQVEASGHLRTLRRLPTPPFTHPSEDRDVLPQYNEELFAGFTGDDIAIERVDGWARPVADLTIVKPEVFAFMMPASQWREYCATYPDSCGDVDRGFGPAKTGTSLGYSALWVSPTVTAEVVEDNEGALVGSWLGPDGQQHLYDVEHFIDPDCELVQRLVHEEDFDPATLGGQHFAVALESMSGRGGVQSELIRVVDSRPIVADPARGRVQVASVRATPSLDMRWVVGASRDLPLEEGDKAWDGPAAEASIFDGAGWSDAPDPDAAKLGFLAYDADAPDLKGSYKFPFARRDESGRLRVPKSGLNAAAQFLPKAKSIPADVRERMRAVIDHYNDKYARAEPARDATQEPPMTLQAVLVGVRDSSAANYLRNHTKLPTIDDLKLTLDEVDAGKLEAKLVEMSAVLASLIEMLKMSEADKDMYETDMAGAKEKLAGMEERMKDMPSVEELTGKLAAAEGEMKKIEEELAAAKAEAAKATDAAKAQIVALTDQLGAATKELEPVRAAELEAARKLFIGHGLDAKEAASCTTIAGVRRAFAGSKISPRYSALSKAADSAGPADKPQYVKSDEVVDDVVDTWLQAAKDSGAGVLASGLSAVPTPRIQPVRAQDQNDPTGAAAKPAPGAATSSLIAVGLD